MPNFGLLNGLVVIIQTMCESFNLKNKVIIGSHLRLILRVVAVVFLLILGILGHQALAIEVPFGGKVEEAIEVLGGLLLLLDHDLLFT